MIRSLLVCLAVLFLPLVAAAQTPDEIAKQILAPLLDPAKVDTLKGDRPINARLYRVFYWLETARRAGGKPADVLDVAQAAARYAETPRAKADRQCIIWSAGRLLQFGCFTPESMAKLRKGGSPQITMGEHAARFYNLEAIPASQNLGKGAKITQREILLARRWNREGLLSAAGLKAVEDNAR